MEDEGNEQFLAGRYQSVLYQQNTEEVTVTTSADTIVLGKILVAVPLTAIRIPMQLGLFVPSKAIFSGENDEAFFSGDPSKAPALDVWDSSVRSRYKKVP